MLISSFPKILTLSGTIPGEPGVGGVILGELQASVPPQCLKFIPAVTRQVIDLGWLDRAPELAGHVLRRYEPACRPVNGIAGEAISWIARKALFERHCRRLELEICGNPAAQFCDKVWAVLDCPTVIQIASSVARQLKKPLVVLVWDAPELLLNRLAMDRWSSAGMLDRFAKTIAQAESVGVICEQMRQAYQRQYGPNDYIVIRHGMRRDMWHQTASSQDSNQIIIGFAGSITAPEPFRQLINTLDACNWRLNGKDVTLRLIGSRYTLDSRQAQRIEYFGWRSLEDTVRLLAECSLLYLPQPFQSHLRPLAELSFPTKLTTYLAAGRRVLLHAPNYASVTPFLARYPVGLQCSALSTSDLQACIEQLLQSPESTIANAINAARCDEFNDTVFLNRFRELVGASPASTDRATAVAKMAEHI